MKTEMLQFLKDRRSIRAYKPEQITDAELGAVLDAAVYAPTAANNQAQKIVAVQNKEDIQALSKLNAAIMGRDTDPYYGAPTIVIVFYPPDNANGVQDGSLILGQLMLAAYAADLGSCWINRELQMFQQPEGKALLKKWGLSEDLIAVGAITLGYAAGEHPQAAPRNPEYCKVIK